MQYEGGRRKLLSLSHLQWRPKRTQLSLCPDRTRKLQLQLNQCSLKATHTELANVLHSCPQWSDLLCETKPDCFSLFHSIVAFMYANQYRQLTPADQSIPLIPPGGRVSIVHPSGNNTGSKHPLMVCCRAETQCKVQH